MSGVCAHRLHICGKGRVLGDDCIIADKFRSLRTAGTFHAMCLTVVQTSSISSGSLLALAEPFPMAKVALRRAARLLTMGAAFRAYYRMYNKKLTQQTRALALANDMQDELTRQLMGLDCRRSDGALAETSLAEPTGDFTVSEYKAARKESLSRDTRKTQALLYQQAVTSASVGCASTRHTAKSTAAASDASDGGDPRATQLGGEIVEMKELQRTLAAQQAQIFDQLSKMDRAIDGIAQQGGGGGKDPSFKSTKDVSFKGSTSGSVDAQLAALEA